MNPNLRRRCETQSDRRASAGSAVRLDNRPAPFSATVRRHVSRSSRCAGDEQRRDPGAVHRSRLSTPQLAIAEPAPAATPQPAAKSSGACSAACLPRSPRRPRRRTAAATLDRMARLVGLRKDEAKPSTNAGCCRQVNTRQAISAGRARMARSPRPKLSRPDPPRRRGPAQTATATAPTATAQASGQRGRMSGAAGGTGRHIRQPLVGRSARADCVTWTAFVVYPAVVPGPLKEYGASAQARCGHRRAKRRFALCRHDDVI